ncbi:MAG: spondin domain-containing protein [Polyangiales bacterium]
MRFSLRMTGISFLAWSSLALLPGCGSDDSSAIAGPDAESDAGTDTAIDTGTEETAADTGTSEETAADTGTETSTDTTPTTKSFEITLEDVSGDTSIWTPISPGVWATHAGADALFEEGEVDRGEGLERIAEEGNNGPLATALTGKTSLFATGTFDVPAGATTKGPALPGHRFVFTVTANASAPNLSFATMFGQSNDTFIAPAGAGIPLFDASGAVLPERDVTDLVYLWDVGSEWNEMPDMGPNQAPRQPAADTGPKEGVIARFTNTTRSLPSALQIAKVEVTAGSGGAFTVKVSNVSGPGSSITTPISPVFYAVHDASWSLFTTGSPAGDSGLENLAEDGNPSMLVTKQTGASGIQSVAARTIPDGAASAGAAQPGHSFTFTVTPDASHRFLSIASMVGESNDAFIAFPPAGIALLNADGSARDAAAIADDLARTLTVWDAGTEKNEVPGVGKNQGPRQGTPNTGAADPDPKVRRYADSTNDLAGNDAGGVVQVRVEAGSDAGHLKVVVTNTSDVTAFPGKASPLVWAVHDGTAMFFESGKAAPMGVERLSEDGNPTMWQGAISGAAFAASGIVNTPSGAASAGPISPGGKYEVVIPIGGSAKYFTYAQMWTPSNDTFLSLGEKGVALVDGGGAPRSIADINADLASMLAAWDAGTEGNQASALGPDQAPRQAAANTGAGEGTGKVRKVDQVWAFPAAKHVVRVHVKPL